jgi:hypothetical protein
MFVAGPTVIRCDKTMSSKTGKSGPKTVFEASMKKVGVEFPLSGHFYREIVLSMNGLKGMSGEFLVHAAVAEMVSLDRLCAARRITLSRRARGAIAYR